MSKQPTQGIIRSYNNGRSMVFTIVSFPSSSECFVTTKVQGGWKVSLVNVRGSPSTLSVEISQMCTLEHNFVCHVNIKTCSFLFKLNVDFVLFCLLLSIKPFRFFFFFFYSLSLLPLPFLSSLSLFLSRSSRPSSDPNFWETFFLNSSLPKELGAGGALLSVG